MGQKNHPPAAEHDTKPTKKTQCPSELTEKRTAPADAQASFSAPPRQPAPASDAATSATVADDAPLSLAPPPAPAPRGRISTGLALCGLLLGVAGGFFAGQYYQISTTSGGQPPAAVSPATTSPAATSPAAASVPGHEPVQDENSVVNAALQDILRGKQAGDAAPPHAARTGTGTARSVTAPSDLLQERIRLLTQRVQQEKNTPRLWAELGNTYFDLDMPQEAIAAYKRCLELAPGNPQVLTDMGIMYREAGQFTNALDSFDTAARLNPPSQNALFNSGVVLYFDLGRKKEARQRWKQLLHINPAARAPDGTPLAELLRKLP